MNDIEEAISYIENTKKHLLHLGETWYADYLDDAIELLKEQETKTGHWTTKRTLQHDGEWYCDQCEYEPTVFEDTPFCPNCGAKMESRWSE